MNHRTLSALKVALLCLLVTGLIAACGGSSNGTKTNGSNGSTVRPSTGQPNPSNKAAGSVNPTPPALTQAAQPNPAPSAVGPVNPTNPATTQPTATASNPSGGSTVQSPAGGNTAVSNDDAKGDAADQALSDLESSLNSVDTIDDLK